MILQRYTLKEAFSPFFLGFVTITFLLVMDFLLDYLKLILEKGVPVLVVAKLFALSLGWMVALSIPCGVLVGMLMTFGRMAQDNEILAIRASGVSLSKLLAPAFVWGGFWTIFLLLFNNFVLPRTNHAFAGLLLEINRQRPTAELDEGVFIDTFEGHRLLFDELDARTGEFRGVKIFDFESGRRLSTTIADTGRIVYDRANDLLVMELERGTILGVPDDAPDARMFRRTRFDRHHVSVGGSEADRERVARRGRGTREMSTQELLDEVRSLEEKRDGVRAHQDEALRALGYGGYADLAAFEDPPGSWPHRVARFLGGRRTADLPGAGQRFVGPPDLQTVENFKMARVQIESLDRRASQHRVEVHKKFSISFASLVFVMLGAPLGMVARRGGVRAGFLGVVFILFYYLCLVGGEQLADRRLLWPWLSMWLANIVLGGLGVYFAMRAMEWRPWRRS